jgi:hypothetical protein
MKAAEEGDSLAYGFIYGAAARLSIMGQAVARRLNMQTPTYVFAGGLLETANILSQRLCELLCLPVFPERLHPPVTGALLALLHWIKRHRKAQC